MQKKYTCSAPGCNRSRRHDGLCGAHLIRRNNPELASRPIKTVMKNKGNTCRLPLCSEPAQALMLCKNHYYKHKRYNKKHVDEMSDWRKPIKKSLTRKGAVKIGAVSIPEPYIQKLRQEAKERLLSLTYLTRQIVQNHYDRLRKENFERIKDSQELKYWERKSGVAEYE